MASLHRHAENRQRRQRREHPWEMGCAARAGDDHPQSSPPSRFRVLEQPLRRAVRGDDARFESDAECLQGIGRVMQGCPIGLAAHDDAYAGRAAVHPQPLFRSVKRTSGGLFKKRARETRPLADTCRTRNHFR
jgi:hypothetical protein